MQFYYVKVPWRQISEFYFGGGGGGVIVGFAFQVGDAFKDAIGVTQWGIIVI